MIYKTRNGIQFKHKRTIDSKHDVYYTDDVRDFWKDLSDDEVALDVERILDEHDILMFHSLYLSVNVDGAWNVDYCLDEKLERYPSRMGRFKHKT